MTESNAPAHLSKTLVSPESPLLESIARYLLDQGESLKDCMVVVPTAQSGRQLRQMLPTLAGRAVLAPSVITADTLFAPLAGTEIASKIQWWHAWSSVLRTIDTENLGFLFPQLEDVDRDFRWGLKAAQRFTKLKGEIATVNLGFSEVAEKSGEPDRWTQLAELDLNVRGVLDAWNLHCPADAKREAASQWAAPLGVQKVILASVPDLPILAECALANSACPVEILVQASEDEAQHFDCWGRPELDHWSTVNLDIPKPESASIEVHPDGTLACEALLRDLQSIDSSTLALAVSDNAFDPLVRDQLSDAGWPSFSPEGKSVSKLGLWDFLQKLRKAIANPHSFLTTPSILKAPESRTLLFEIKSPASLAQAIDKLASEHLPQNLGHAIRCSNDELENVLTELQALLIETQGSSPSRAMEIIFDRIERSVDFPEELIDPFLEAIESIKHLEDKKLAPHAAESLDLILSACEGCKIASDRAGTVIDQNGWLELPYTAEPHLRILGLHETCVPERPHDDGFLPESLRRQIKLFSRQQLEARDSYLLTQMMASRKSQGSVKFYLSQTSPSGEERQASRLLMRCPDEQLPARVQHCFPEEIAQKDQLPAYSSGDWKLRLQHGQRWPEDKQLAISPNRLKDYLLCPFRFYLTHVEGFRRLEFDTQELDSAQFGTLVHDVLESYGLNENLRDLDDVDDIARAFITLLDELFSQRYGEEPSLPLSIQKESALQRLISFAPEQAQMRRDGWRIQHVELAIGTKDDEIKWDFAGVPVRMRIDRIDIHETTGALRVIDYKTSKKAKQPNDEHLENIRASDLDSHLHGEPIEPSGRARSQRRWKNLQLPLYAEFVRQHFQTEALPELAYVSFPAATSDTGMRPWNEYDEELHSSAIEWAETVVEKIQNSEFPVRELPSAAKSWDRFAALSPESIETVFETPAL